MASVILVTGGHGFIGGHLVPALTAAGHRVHAPSRSAWNVATAAPSLARPEWVIHLAGRTFVPDSWRNVPDFIETNVVGTINVLEYCRAVRARLLFVSSYVYGVPETLPIAEQHPLRAVNPYGLSKIMAEDAVRFYVEHFGVDATIVRPFNLYGPGQPSEFLIPTIVRQAIDPRAGAIELNELETRRDYLYVDDFVALLGAVIRTGRSGVYNAGSGRSYSVRMIADCVQRAANTAKPVSARNLFRVNEIPDVVADVSNAASNLGWAPAVDLDQGIVETVRWATCRQPAS